MFRRLSCLTVLALVACTTPREAPSSGVPRPAGWRSPEVEWNEEDTPPLRKFRLVQWDDEMEEQGLIATPRKKDQKPKTTLSKAEKRKLITQKQRLEARVHKGVGDPSQCLLAMAGPKAKRIDVELDMMISRTGRITRSDTTIKDAPKGTVECVQKIVDQVQLEDYKSNQSKRVKTTISVEYTPSS